MEHDRDVLLLCTLGSWRAASEKEIATFCVLITPYEYEYEALIDAWVWFDRGFHERGRLDNNYDY